MITFYRTGFRRLERALGPIARWCRRHPRWALVIGFVLGDAFVICFGNTYAYADNSDSSPLAPFLPGGSLHDSAGVSVAAYAQLPIDRGDAFTYQKSIISMVVDFIWSGHLGFVAWMLAFLNWLLSFQWVSWIATPFTSLGDFAHTYLSGIAWVPFALMITAVVAGFSLFAGKWAGGLSEMFISVVCAVLATGLLANPVASLTNAGGALDTARSYGSEVAASVVQDGNAKGAPVTTFNSDDILSESVTTELIDIFVRAPAETIAFGHTLSEQCSSIFENEMKTSSPIATSASNTVRDAVGQCDPEAQKYVSNPNPGEIFTAGVISTGGFTLFMLSMAIALLLLVTIVFCLLEALKLTWNIYLGILPVNRQPLWKSLMGVLMGLVSIVFVVVVLAAYLKLLVAVLNASSGLGVFMQMAFVDIFVVVLMFLLWRVRHAAKRAGNTMAEQLSKLGLSKGGAKIRDRSAAIATMGVAGNMATSLLRKKPQSFDNRSINFFEGDRSALLAGVQASGPIDAGTVTAVPDRAPRPSGPDTGSPRALGAGGKPGAGQKAARFAFGAAQLTAAAASGGTSALATQAAKSAGSAVARKGIEHAVAHVNGTQTAPPVVGRRIEVDSKGVGHIRRPEPPTPQVHDISSMPPRRSPQNLQLRELIATKGTTAA